MNVTVRTATTADAGRCAEIYAPYVVGSAVSFELEAPTEQEMARRIEAAIAWLVAEDEAGRVLGYAYAGPHHQRAAYRFSCDVSVYVDRAAQGAGVGRTVYAALFERLAARGYRMACAGITQPNPASVAIHWAFGFADVGLYRNIGWKDGAWRDVLWMQKPLGPDGPPRGEPDSLPAPFGDVTVP